MKQLEYPFDPENLLKKKKSIKKTIIGKRKPKVYRKKS